MSWTSLAPGGLPAIIGAIVAAVVGLLAIVRRTGYTAGRDAQIAREAKAREQGIELIKRASGARPVGGVLDDPNNRDRPA